MGYGKGTLAKDQQRRKALSDKFAGGHIKDLSDLSRHKFNPDREQVSDAVEEFLKRGGKIKLSINPLDYEGVK